MLCCAGGLRRPSFGPGAAEVGRRWDVQRSPRRLGFYHGALRLRAAVRGGAHRPRGRGHLPGCIDSGAQGEGGRCRRCLRCAWRVRHVGPHGGRALRRPEGGSRRQRLLLWRRPATDTDVRSSPHRVVGQWRQQHGVLRLEASGHATPQRRDPAGRGGHRGALASQGLLLLRGEGDGSHDVPRHRSAHRDEAVLSGAGDGRGPRGLRCAPSACDDGRAIGAARSARRGLSSPGPPPAVLR
mmetsp:Transcript_1816/g.5133  ORF Transcript_1816/g.5133 Transcript_1816/m.5133 type:complete len:240 (-) Transcript_1816:165-884(-)